MIRWLERNNKISWFLAILTAILIFYVSSLNFYGKGGGLGIQAILYHIGIFFILSFFLLTALVRGKRENFLFLAVFLAVMYGISDEFHQGFVPGRASSVVDVVYDSFGAVTAYLIYHIRMLWNKTNLIL